MLEGDGDDLGEVGFGPEAAGDDAAGPPPLPVRRRIAAPDHNQV